MTHNEYVLVHCRDNRQPEDTYEEPSSFGQQHAYESIRLPARKQ